MHGFYKELEEIDRTLGHMVPSSIGKPALDTLSENDKSIWKSIEKQLSADGLKNTEELKKAIIIFEKTKALQRMESGRDIEIMRKRFRRDGKKGLIAYQDRIILDTSEHTGVLSLLGIDGQKNSAAMSTPA